MALQIITSKDIDREIHINDRFAELNHGYELSSIKYIMEESMLCINIRTDEFFHKYLYSDTETNFMKRIVMSIEDLIENFHDEGIDGYIFDSEVTDGLHIFNFKPLIPYANNCLDVFGWHNPFMWLNKFIFKYEIVSDYDLETIFNFISRYPYGETVIKMINEIELRDDLYFQVDEIANPDVCRNWINAIENSGVYFESHRLNYTCTFEEMID